MFRHLSWLTADSPASFPFLKGRQSGNLLGESFLYYFSWVQNHTLKWLGEVHCWDAFSFVMLHSANRGHWRAGADSIAPKDVFATVSTGLPAAEGHRSSPGWMVGFGSLGWCLLLVIIGALAMHRRHLMFLPSQLWSLCSYCMAPSPGWTLE